MQIKLKSILGSKEFKNAGWLIGGKVVQMLLSLVVGVLTARYLGPGNYGLINYGMAFVAFFSSIATLGLNSVIIKDFTDNPDDQGEAIGSALLMRFLSSLLSAVMIVCIVFLIDRDEPLTITVTALCSLGALFQIFETFNYWFQFQYKSKITSIASLCAYVVTSIYRIILLAFEKDVRWFAFASSVDYIVVAVFLYVAYRIHDGKKLRFSFSKSKSLLRISYNYILSSMMVAVYGQTDKLMLKQMMNESEVGYYSTAVAICSMWTFVLQAIIDSLYPSILRLKNVSQSDYDRKNRQLYALVFYISALVSVAFMIFGRFVVGLLYGDEYLPSVSVLKIITWYTAFSYLGVARNAWIVSEGKQKYLKYIYGCAVVANIAINALLIPVLGASGAALASLITQFLTSMFLPLLFKDLRPNAKLMFEAVIFKGVF